MLSRIKKNRISVIGMGYVGFPLACAIARSKKYEVVGVDISKEKIDLIKKRISPVDDKIAEKDIKEVNIKATTSFLDVKGSKFILLCVPTPVTEYYEPDYTPLKSAAKAIAPYIEKGSVVIIESTINPGASEEEIMPILEKYSGLKAGVDFDLAHCPERIDPGNEQWNVYNIPRNIGSTSPEGTKKAAEFYRSFLDVEINEMSSLKVVEATKIIENTFRDINIAYVNELAKSFDIMGIDLVEVIKGASNKPFAFMPHFPGCGVGGHCIPVDPYYLIEKASKSGFEHLFLKSARKVNNNMPGYVVSLLAMGLNDLGIAVKNAKIGVLGLSYKANVGDSRESPSYKILKSLQKYDPKKVMVSDPYINEGTYPIEEVLSECDAIIIATNHREYMNIEDWKDVKLIIDGRNCLDKEKIISKGIYYKGVGRGRSKVPEMKAEVRYYNRNI